MYATALERCTVCTGEVFSDKTGEDSSSQIVWLRPRQRSLSLYLDPDPPLTLAGSRQRRKDMSANLRACTRPHGQDPRHLAENLIWPQFRRLSDRGKEARRRRDLLYAGTFLTGHKMQLRRWLK